MISFHTIKHDDLCAPQVWALREAVLRAPLGLSLRNEDLSGEAADHIVIAEEKGKVIGCVMLRHISEREGKLRQMAVAAHFQGVGIGSALLREAESFAKGLGISTLMLHARAYAIPFYERAGYAMCSTLFEEVGIPHRVMQKILS